MDIFSSEKRSQVMAKVRSKNTVPERIVRSMLHEMGYRFRLHRNDLPGRADIVLPKYKTVIFVHGCFWHMHPGCKKAAIPEINHDMWQKKLERNVARDVENQRELIKLGWHVRVIWECEVRKKKMIYI
ncbi:DNA mismatch endonuclease Vsr [Anaerospora sp.]|uniref:very short patch repair endonuclease n=1 Tax=Anaerospora sp. TaxID=1960278 RepID=UPI002899FE19|nr:DNA mismatch endonuclease Vsr [Anaerospora sp.]